jgi:hypothetical protein
MRSREHLVAEIRQPMAAPEVVRPTRSSTGWALVVVLLVSATVGLISANRFPVFDDEANAITNSSADMNQILSKGLGRQRQFHPPLGEVILHSWLVSTGSRRTAVVRVPAIVFWVTALAALFWALRPIASREASLAAVVTAALWPAHLILPFSATWYSLAALLCTLSFGALMRALCASSSRKAGTALAASTVAIVALAYTVFAWPFVVGAELMTAAFVFGTPPFRRHWRVFVGLGMALTVAVAPTMRAAFARVGPMLHRQAGGGPIQSLGAVLSLLIGHSAPARPWIVCFVALAVVGVAVGVVGSERKIWCVVAVGMIALAGLAVTNTLNDKRLLLGSLFFSAGLGLRIGERRGRLALALCAVAALPAWLGWVGVTSFPWLFPRWQDPVEQLASLHTSALAPRLLVTNEPAVAFYAAERDGDSGPLWSNDPMGATSSRWFPARPDVLLAAIAELDRRGMRTRTIDVVLSTKMQGRGIAVRDAFQSVGWRVVNDRSFGEDPLSQFRHPGAGSARFRFIRLDRGDAASHGASTGIPSLPLR